MSEANGIILLKLSQDLTENLVKAENEFSWEQIRSILQWTQTESHFTAHPILRYHVQKSFHHEGLSHSDSWLEISIFGEEWMHLMMLLLKHGHHLEVYGWIHHEYGLTEYYALDLNAKAFRGKVDYEDGDEDEDMDETARSIVAEWLSKVPQEVRSRFPHVFEVESASEEDEE